MTQRQIEHMSEGDAIAADCWVLWLLICQPHRIFSERDRQEWIARVRRERAERVEKKK